MAELEIKGMRIGAGRTKAIVSLMEEDRQGLLDVAARAVEAGADCLEWRVDTFGTLDQTDEVAATLQALAEALPQTPLIFTLRSQDQGGTCPFGQDTYESLTRLAIDSGLPDLVDIEVGLGDSLVKELTAAAHQRGLHVIASYHDFTGTPETEWMRDELVRMAGLGVDIAKLAVRAEGNADSHRLMRATALARDEVEIPLVTMAMGAAGQNSRLSGEVFGSAMTFCALGKVSAPGQVELAEALPVLEAMHRTLSTDTKA